MKTRKGVAEVVSINGVLKEIVTVYDKSGKVLHKAIRPLMLEFTKKDVMQVIVGSTLLAVPVSLTEEVWILAEELSLRNAFYISGLSLLFVGMFVYYNVYRGHLVGHFFEFFKRTLGVYLLSFAIASLLLTLWQKAPWDMDALVAIKRAVIVALPASMSAAVADMIK